MATRAQDFMEKVPSRRFGDPDGWCHPRGRYEVDGEQRLAAFFFHIKDRNAAETVIHLRCSKYRNSNRCPVQADIKVDGEIILVRGVHNHPPEQKGHGVQYRTTRRNWLSDLQEDSCKQPVDVILDHRRQLPLNPAATIVPVQHLRTARRVAAKTRPPNVKSLAQLHAAISDVEIAGYTLSANGEVRLQSYYSADHDLIVITTTPLVELLSQATIMHADATYKVVPRKLACQLFTVHGNWEGHVGIVACALMNSKTADAYRWVFSRLKEVWPGLIVRNYMGDWDQAMRSAVRSEFPDAAIYGCLFHYAQSLLRNASKPAIGLASDLRRPCDVLKKFLGFTALPLLPAEAIMPTFEELVHAALSVDPRFEGFVRYVRSEWLTKIGAEGMSVFGLLARTNNAVESNNAALSRRLGAHGPTWNLMKVILDMSTDTWVDHTILTEGTFTIRSRPSRGTESNEVQISRAVGLLNANAVTPFEFIGMVKYRVGGAAYRHGILNEGNEGDVVLVQPSMDLQEWLIQNDHTYPETPQGPLSEHSYARAPG